MVAVKYRVPNKAKIEKSVSSGTTIFKEKDFRSARSAKVLVNGLIIHRKSSESFEISLELIFFKASNGWLGRQKV